MEVRSFLQSLPVQLPDGRIIHPQALNGQMSPVREVTMPVLIEGTPVAARIPMTYRNDRDPLLPKQRTTVFVYDKKWYFRIKSSSDEGDDSPDRSPDTIPKEHTAPKRQARGLLDDVPISQLDGKLVICLITQTNVRLYALFDSYLEFALFQGKIEEHKRCFYEVAFGEFPQKPHFDVDLDLVSPQTIEELTVTGDMITDTIVELVATILGEKGIILNLERDILIYTSHSPTKRSFHIVINNYCHSNNKESRALYDQVTARFPDPLKRYVTEHKVDPAVYSPKQQFRVLGSQKLNSGRIKRFLKEWSFRGQTVVHRYIETPDSPEYEGVLQLEESLLTSTSSCNILPSLLSPESGEKYGGSNGSLYAREDISKDLAVRAVKLVAEMAQGTINDRNFPYKIANITGGIIGLKRLKPSRCQICNRVHEHENPYLVVAGDGPSKNVYFYCRRAPPDKKILVGKLDDAGGVDVLEVSTPPASTPPKEPTIIDTTAFWCNDVVQRMQELSMEQSGKSVKIPVTTGEIGKEVVRGIAKSWTVPPIGWK